ncbi:MAG TPA: hypothetical protein PKX91_05410 [Clostridia bacterium]|jgi:hypothetical protein|nr:hypothetical protein [Clostridia bacterium]
MLSVSHGKCGIENASIIVIESIVSAAVISECREIVNGNRKRDIERLAGSYG